MSNGGLMFNKFVEFSPCKKITHSIILEIEANAIDCGEWGCLTTCSSLITNQYAQLFNLKVALYKSASLVRA